MIDDIASWFQARLILFPLAYVLIETIIHYRKRSKHHARHHDLQQP